MTDLVFLPVHTILITMPLFFNNTVIPYVFETCFLSLSGSFTSSPSFQNAPSWYSLWMACSYPWAISSSTLLTTLVIYMISFPILGTTLLPNVGALSKHLNLDLTKITTPLLSMRNSFEGFYIFNPYNNPIR